MLTILRSPHRREAGGAMIMAIALLVLGAFVAVAVVVSAMSSSDTARRQLESGATEQLARDAGEILTEAYSASESGEFDGFVPRRAVLQRHATRIAGGQVIDNPRGYRNVRDTVPNDRDRRVTVVQKLDDGRDGLWQLFGVQVPVWGSTPSGTVKVYVRAWTRAAAGGANTKPVIYEMTLRPEWFADYQILVDGKLKLGSTARIDGRVHSNGTTSSIFNVYRTEPWQVSIGDPGDAAQCSRTATITAASGTFFNAPQCRAQGGKVEVRRGQHVNILRADDAIDRIRTLCPGGGVPSPRLRVVCRTGAVTNVSVNGNTVRVNGQPFDAEARARGNQGVVVVATGDVHMSGTQLGRQARLLVIASAPRGAQRYGSGGRPPSVYIRTNRAFGAQANAPASSFGLIAQGNVVVDELAGCPSAVRGAFISISGALSSNPTWIVPFVTGGGRSCGGRLSIEGSIVGHFQPLLWVNGSNVGFQQRSYSMLPSLYHNPPPMYPTSADWQVVRFAPADLSRF